MKYYYWKIRNQIIFIKISITTEFTERVTSFVNHCNSEMITNIMQDSQEHELITRLFKIVYENIHKH